MRAFDPLFTCLFLGYGELLYSLLQLRQQEYVGHVKLAGWDTQQGTNLTFCSGASWRLKGKIRSPDYKFSWPTQSLHNLHKKVKILNVEARSNWSNMLIKHVGQTCWSNIVGCNMFDLFEQLYETCWTVLDRVGWNYTMFKLFIQHCPTFSPTWSKSWVLVPKSNIVGWCWIRLNVPVSSTIQHWSNTVLHQQTMLDNV